MLSFQYIEQTINQYFANQNDSVKEVYLFGSYARGEQTEESDVDIIVCLDRQSADKPMFNKWHTDLQILFNCKVDMISGTDENHIGPNFRFRQEINRRKVLIYSKPVAS